MLGTTESATRNYSVSFLSTTAATIAAFFCTSTHYRVDINFENQISRSITVSIVCVIAIWSMVRGNVFIAQQESHRVYQVWQNERVMSKIWCLSLIAGKWILYISCDFGPWLFASFWSCNNKSNVPKTVRLYFPPERNWINRNSRFRLSLELP